MTNEFAQQFLALRKARGLTQRAAADLLCNTVPSIQNWERGRSAPWPVAQKMILEKLENIQPVEKEDTRHKRYMTGIYNALAEGRKAYGNKIPQEWNPYKRYDMRKCWADGWDEARRRLSPLSTPFLCKYPECDGGNATGYCRNECREAAANPPSTPPTPKPRT